MKARRRALLLIAAGVLLFGVVAGLHAWLSPRLPHVKLKDGGELQVLQVRYGTGWAAHELARAPEWKFRLWKALPALFHRAPEEGAHTVAVDGPAVSIWCAWKHPEMRPTGIHEVGSVKVTPDNGEVLRGMWVISARGYQEILVEEPPRDSRYLRVEAENPWEGAAPPTVPITIDNPAYHQP